MAIEIIPDKICPHCGGNKWSVYVEKTKRGTFINRHRCWNKQKIYDITSKINNPENVKKYSKISTKRAVDRGYYRTNERQSIKRQECRNNSVNLTKAYLRKIIYNVYRKNVDTITNEEFLNLRNKLIKIRKRRLIPKTIKRSQNQRRYRRRLRRKLRKRLQNNNLSINLTDSYIKHVIKVNDRYYGIITKIEDISQQDIDDYREIIKAQRKFKTRIKQEQLIKN